MKYIIYYKQPNGYENVLTANNENQLLDELDYIKTQGDVEIIKIYTPNN